MAYDNKNLTKLAALEELANRIKAELTPISTGLAAAFKSGKVDGNTVSFFTSADQTGEAAFSMDFPVEMFLDQAKTTFVAKFAWDETTYPGSTDPALNNKPVMVLAVKGSDDTCTYSFLNMAALVDTYSAADGTVTVDGYTIKVNVSAEAGNRLVAKPDGLYVEREKVEGAVAGNLAGLDANGNLTDSGKKPTDFVAAEAGKRLMTDAEGTKLEGIAEGATKVEASDTAGNIKVNGNEVQVVGIATDAEVTEMLNTVFGTNE